MAEKGYIHVYTGNGKGKTTAALGLALRAAGAGKKIYIAQFVKGMKYAEIDAIERYLKDSITTQQFGLDCFIEKKPEQKDIDAAVKGLQEVKKIIVSEIYNVLILDEATIALYYKLFSIKDFLDVLALKPNNLEIIITGRYASDELLKIADLVTVMQEEKHYYQKGINARKGIEF